MEKGWGRAGIWKIFRNSRTILAAILWEEVVWEAQKQTDNMCAQIKDLLVLLLRFAKMVVSQVFFAIYFQTK